MIRGDPGTPMLPLDSVSRFGPEVNRPECVLATATGDLFVSDGRGGVTCIDAEGNATLLLAARPPEAGFVANGIALERGRSLLVANIGLAGGIWRLFADGGLEPVIPEVEGLAVTQANFVGLDGQDRIWASVSTRRTPIADAAFKGMADGYIILKDRRGSRVACDGIGFTNECKVDPSGRWLYVVETIGRSLLRLPIAEDGSLGRRETVTVFDRPGSFPDGIAFDAEGGVWVTSIVRNGLVRVDPSGAQQWVLEDVDEAHVEAVERVFQSGGFAGWSGGAVVGLSLPTSLAFAGPDLRTGVIGFLRETRLARFASPFAGAPPPHWLF